MSKIAVTGATGHLGGLIVQGLLARRVSTSNIVPLVRTERQTARFRELGLRPRVTSYDDPLHLQASLVGIDTMVLISPPGDRGNSVDRLRLLLGAVFAAQGAGIKHLAYVGLAAPELRVFKLEDVELAVEHAIRAVGLPYTFLRNSVYFDELGPEINIAITTGELVSASGNGPLNWVPRSSLAEAAVEALLNDNNLNQTYELVAAETFTYDDLADAISAFTGRSITHSQAPRDDAKQALQAGGATDEFATMMVDVFHRPISEGKFRATGHDLQHLTGQKGTLDVASIRAIADLAT